METFQLIYKKNTSLDVPFEPDLILLFGSRQKIDNELDFETLKSQFPNAHFGGCSTAGHILESEVHDNDIALTFIKFRTTRIEQATVDLNEVNFNSEQAGMELVSAFRLEGLKHLLVFSDGLEVNGSALTNGMLKMLPPYVSITGGLAADGSDFNETGIVNNDGVHRNIVTAIGFYGRDLHVSFGSRGGWDSFGIDRRVTSSKDNVLYEIDGVPALDLYKTYLGDRAKDLPASGLLFPLSMRYKADTPPLVRTILGVDEETKSLTFAGDIPEGSYVRLMKANIDRIITGAEDAAKTTKLAVDAKPELSILVSCVGRKLVLKQMVEEEVEAVNEILDPDCCTGFYSYGEIAPMDKYGPCTLHNQTMTITSFSENS